MLDDLSKKVISYDAKIAIIGLGYVGLPLAVEFSKLYKTIGFDLNKKRISELKNSHDKTNELSKEQLNDAKKLKYTSNVNDIEDYNIFIVTVPTPIDSNKDPDLSMLKDASNSIGSVLKNGDVVIYESTVFPGATEEICLPILEKVSGLKLNKDFYIGYSPERINPGDKNHNLVNIKKVVSGSNSDAANLIEKLYKSIVKAGVHKTSSIKIAEAAKVIENTQRDINIALMNELSMIFDKLNINTEEVLKAAETKWNFISFRPGLVGGHCIGVDPYYLTHKAKSVGINPEVILAGRKINDEMSIYIADRLIKKMKENQIKIDSANILVMGFAFKENCPDHRNTKVIDLIQALNKKVSDVFCFDPYVDSDSVYEQYGIKLISKPEFKKYNAVIIAVAHDEFKNMSLEKIKGLMVSDPIIYDVKNIIKDKTDKAVIS
tara:strand:+ start:6362 stop:7663 length:1302 start_codon:yes stop_codon:yes gene_type:complete